MIEAQLQFWRTLASAAVLNELLEGQPVNAIPSVTGGCRMSISSDTPYSKRSERFLWAGYHPGMVGVDWGPKGTARFSRFCVRRHPPSNFAL
jgi:hypothetical protein